MKKLIIAAAIIFSTLSATTVSASAFSNKKDVGTADNNKGCRYQADNKEDARHRFG
jgi:hypothetical protein